MLHYIDSFLRELSFPKEAVEDLVKNYELLRTKDDSLKHFNELVDYFKEHNGKAEYQGIFSRLDDIASQLEMSKYSLHMLYLIALSIQTRELYEKKNISYDIYLNSMSDLRAKLLECRELHNVW